MTEPLDIPDDPGRVGVIAVCVRDGQMLVIRRSRHVVAPLVYCYPGGGIEPAESQTDALIRECHEELGVTVRPIRQVWQSVTSWKVSLTWWTVELADGQPLRPNPEEVESVHWMTPEEMAALPDLLPNNREFLELVRSGEIRLEEG